MRRAAFFSLGAVTTVAATDPAAVARAWRGEPLEALIEDGVRRFRKGEAAGLRYDAWERARAHRRRGDLVVLVADATPDVTGPLSGELAADTVIGAEPELSDDGRLTGALRTRPGDGTELAAAVTAFAAAEDVNLTGSTSYVGPKEDTASLGVLGHGERIEGAERQAGRLDGARTAAAYGTFLASTGVGLAAGLLGRSRRTGVDAMTRTFGQLGPLVAGVRLNVQGAEHARSPRPAVFMLNHQSSLVDAIVTFRLLGAEFSPVAKREVRSIPLVGQATWLADWAFVDRVGDRAKAVAAVQDGVDKLRGGVSVILAPEGTRSAGPTPGPFKKGGFFMAREAGVPVIPIVIRNAGELMWRSGRSLKPGTVDVAVLEPIWCNWSDEELADRVEEVRGRYLDTLEAWPGRSR